LFGTASTAKRKSCAISNVLEYHRHVQDRGVMTPSYQNVSTEIYKTARQRWRNYETQLAPVVAVLEPFIRKFGYRLSSLRVFPPP
jgi:hypothetical protein